MRAAALSYMHLMLAEILHQAPVTVVRSTGVQVARRAAAFIADHLTEPELSTAGVAAALGFNADYLGRAFRAAFNVTPTDHIHRLRIDRARMLFRSTNRSVQGWPPTSASATIDTSGGSSNARSVSRLHSSSVCDHRADLWDVRTTFPAHRVIHGPTTGLGHLVS